MYSNSFDWNHQRGMPVPLMQQHYQSGMMNFQPQDQHEIDARYQHYQAQRPYATAIAPISRNNISEIVQVPPELGSFVADPQFKQILLKVKEQSNINTIQVDHRDSLACAIIIDAPTGEAALLARKLIEIHFKQQLKIIAAEERLQRVKMDLFSAQGEMASGLMVEFSVDPALLGVIIGKKGARIKKVEDEEGVTNVNVDGVTGRIKVIGRDAASVQRAREQLEVVEKSFTLNSNQWTWFSNDHRNGSLNDIKEAADILVARVHRDEEVLTVIGTTAAVKHAEIVLNTQLEYIDRQMGIESTVKEHREQLFNLRKQYGIKGEARAGAGDKEKGSEGRPKDRPERQGGQGGLGPRDERLRNGGLYMANRNRDNKGQGELSADAKASEGDKRDDALPPRGGAGAPPREHRSKKADVENEGGRSSRRRVHRWSDDDSSERESATTASHDDRDDDTDDVETKGDKAAPQRKAPLLNPRGAGFPPRHPTEIDKGAPAPSPAPAPALAPTPAVVNMLPTGTSTIGRSTVTVRPKSDMIGRLSEPAQSSNKAKGQRAAPVPAPAPPAGPASASSDANPSSSQGNPSSSQGNPSSSQGNPSSSQGKQGRNVRAKKSAPDAMAATVDANQGLAGADAPAAAVPSSGGPETNADTTRTNMLGARRGLAKVSAPAASDPVPTHGSKADRPKTVEKESGAAPTTTLATNANAKKTQPKGRQGQGSKSSSDEGQDGVDVAAATAAVAQMVLSAHVEPSSGASTSSLAKVPNSRNAKGKGARDTPKEKTEVSAAPAEVPTSQSIARGKGRKVTLFAEAPTPTPAAAPVPSPLLPEQAQGQELSKGNSKRQNTNTAKNARGGQAKPDEGAIASAPAPVSTLVPPPTPTPVEVVGATARAAGLGRGRNAKQAPSVTPSLATAPNPSPVPALASTGAPTEAASLAENESEGAAGGTRRGTTKVQGRKGNPRDATKGKDSSAAASTEPGAPADLPVPPHSNDNASSTVDSKPPAPPTKGKGRQPPSTNQSKANVAAGLASSLMAAMKDSVAGGPPNISSRNGDGDVDVDLEPLVPLDVELPTKVAKRGPPASPTSPGRVVRGLGIAGIRQPSSTSDGPDTHSTA